ncbi:MAG TPA: hypothetical protein VK447_20960 [Myxococcaceae bacterium]|nr:hypothetical protein [Myxococcaceae bacterium]
MKRLSAAIVVALSLTACQRPGDEFREGLPKEDMVKLNVPANSSNALTDGTGQSQHELKGDTAGLYVLTRGATVIVNGGAVAVLGLVKAITNHPPTSLKENSAVWGPHTEALSPTTWKLTVTRTAARDFTYALEGKAKTAADSAYVVVLSGSHKAGSVRDTGTGTFLLDWDRLQTLPEHDDNVGTAQFDYSRDPSGAVTVTTHFTQVKDGASTHRIDADYRYASQSHGGTFEFSTQKDMGGGTAKERLTIKSRWKPTGAGRSDVKASGGDFSTAATVSECWDTSFKSQYLNVSYEASQNYGTEATDCAFVGAEFSTLQ